jgi:hypothetical protein
MSEILASLPVEMTAVKRFPCASPLGLASWTCVDAIRTSEYRH